MLNLQQLVIHIDFSSQGSVEFPHPPPPLLEAGALSRLTKLEICSHDALSQVIAFGT